jgi:hypothetical protein
MLHHVNSVKPIKIGMVATVLPRIEVAFIEEWLTYYTALGLDPIILYADVRENVEDRFFDNRMADRKKYVWSKKPHFDYHEHLSHDEVIDLFRQKVEKFPTAELITKGIYYDRWPVEELTVTAIQAASINHVVDTRDDIDFLCHFDIDEFLVPRYTRHQDISLYIHFLCRKYFAIDDPKHLGFRQIVMGRRWSKPGVDRSSVLDICCTKGEMPSFFDNFWKTIYHVPTLRDMLNRGEPNSMYDGPFAPPGASKLVHGFGLCPSTKCVDSTMGLLFHYCGWDDHTFEHETSHLGNMALEYNTDEALVYSRTLLKC